MTSARRGGKGRPAMAALGVVDPRGGAGAGAGGGGGEDCGLGSQTPPPTLLHALVCLVFHGCLGKNVRSFSIASSNSYFVLFRPRGCWAEILPNASAPNILLSCGLLGPY